MEIKLGNWKVTIYSNTYRLYRAGWMIAYKQPGEKLWLDRIHHWRWGRWSFLVK
jgi:hypothetical protein